MQSQQQQFDVNTALKCQPASNLRCTAGGWKQC